MKQKVLFSWVLAFICDVKSTSSQPVEPMDKYDCESIAVLEYCGPAGLYNRDFHVVEILSGPPFPRDVSVRYDKSIKPEKNSRWIVFIPFAAATDGKLDLHHGSFGIVPFTRDQFLEVLHVLAKRRHIEYDKSRVDWLSDCIEHHYQTRGNLEHDLAR